MAKLKFYLCLCVALLFCNTLLIAQNGVTKKSAKGTRIHIGTGSGFYQLLTKHALTPSPRLNFTAGFRHEIHFDRTFKNYFAFGVDYLAHGLAYKSYYFEPNTVKIYDKSFPFQYQLYVHELNLPLHYKYLFKRADNSLFSSYVSIGYHLRYLLASSLRVKQNGNQLIQDNPDIIFTNALFHDKLNAFVSCAIGWQKNNLASSKGSFFVELNARYGFSAFGFETDYSAASLRINGTLLCIQLGFKI